MIELRCTLDRPRIRRDVASDVNCQIEVRATGELAAARRELRVHLCLVFDCSGSMAGAKTEAAIAAALKIANTIDERHRISLVGFATSHWVLVENACPAETGREPIRLQIERMRDFIRGTTNLAEGIRRGMQVVQRTPADARVLVVLTDGEADSQVEAIRAGMEASAASIQVNAVGVGDDFKADDLLAVVTPSNGAVLGEREAGRLEAAFGTLLGRIESFVATNAQLGVTLEAGVHAGAVYKTSPERMLVTNAGNRTMSLQVGNIERDQTYAFLVTLTPPAGGSGEVELGRVTVRYDVPARKLRDQVAHASIVVTYDDRAQGENREVAQAHRRAQLAELVDDLAESERRADRATSAKLLAELRQRSLEQGDPRVIEALRNLAPPIAQADLNALVLAVTARDASPPAPRAVPPPPPPARPAAPTPPPPEPVKAAVAGPVLNDVVLIDPGPSAIELMRKIRELTGLGLADIDKMIKEPPSTIIAVEPEQARSVKQSLEALGARIDVRPQRP